MSLSGGRLYGQSGTDILNQMLDQAIDRFRFPAAIDLGDHLKGRESGESILFA